MKIVDTLVVAQDKSIVILKADNKYYLLSVSQTDIKLITELEGFDESNVISVSEGSVYENIDFKNVLTQLLPKKKK